MRGIVGSRERLGCFSSREASALKKLEKPIARCNKRSRMLDARQPSTHLPQPQFRLWQGAGFGVLSLAPCSAAKHDRMSREGREHDPTTRDRGE